MSTMHLVAFACSALLLWAGVANGSDLQDSAQFGDDDCSSSQFQNACVQREECAWCGVGELPPACLQKSLVGSLPTGTVRCHNGADSLFAMGRKAVVSQNRLKLTIGDFCSDANDAPTCRGKPGCTWCNSKVSWISSECFDSVGTSEMDAGMFTCEHTAIPAVLPGVEAASGQADKVYGGATKPGSYPPPSPPHCEDIVSKGECNDRHNCNWCVLKFTGEGTCFTQSEAKYLPPFVFHCSKKSRPSDFSLSRFM